MWLGHANLKGGMRPAGSGLVRAAGVTFVALLVANCSQQKLGRLIDSKYGVAASPKVIADGEPVPKGGGRDFLGRPYTVAGRTYVPQANQRYAGEGLASWYGVDFHGRLTANGEIFDRDAIAAAHTTMPLPSYARVTNLQNGRSIIVRVNDRGPFHANRVIDVSERTAEALEFRRIGTARVRVEYVEPRLDCGQRRPNSSGEPQDRRIAGGDSGDVPDDGGRGKYPAAPPSQHDGAQPADPGSRGRRRNFGAGAFGFDQGAGHRRRSATSRASLRSRHDPPRCDADRDDRIPAKGGAAAGPSGGGGPLLQGAGNSALPLRRAVGFRVLAATGHRPRQIKAVNILVPWR